MHVWKWILLGDFHGTDTQTPGRLTSWRLPSLNASDRSTHGSRSDRPTAFRLRRDRPHRSGDSARRLCPKGRTVMASMQRIGCFLNVFCSH